MVMLAVEDDEAFNSVQVSLPGSDAVVLMVLRANGPCRVWHLITVAYLNCNYRRLLGQRWFELGWTLIPWECYAKVCSGSVWWAVRSHRLVRSNRTASIMQQADERLLTPDPDNSPAALG